MNVVDIADTADTTIIVERNKTVVGCVLARTFDHYSRDSDNPKLASTPVRRAIVPETGLGVPVCWGGRGRRYIFSIGLYTEYDVCRNRGTINVLNRRRH